MAITPYSGTVPNRISAGDNEAYAAEVYNYLNYINGTFVTTVNSTEANINNKEASVVAKEAKVVAKEALMNPHYTAIDAVYANAKNINSVATTIVPNITEILQADTNAAIATTKAGEANTDANSASASATIATTQAGIATSQAIIAGDYANSAIVTSLSTTTNLPIIKPSLSLDFANSKHVDSRITFTRASSGTIYNEDGLIESVASGVPRITHNPVTGECEGLLVEEARTNLLTYSEQFDNAAWVKTNSTIIPNEGISPDGNTTMDLLVDNTDTVAMVHCTQNKTLTANTTYTISAFVKRKDYRYVAIQPATASNWAGATDRRIFDLETATQTSGAAGGLIEHIGNGVYRVSMTVLFGAADANGGIHIFTSSSPTTYSVQRTVGLGNYIWGAQIEAGTEPSSYIPSTETFTSRASAATYYGSDGLLKSAPVDTVRMNYNPTNLKVAPRMLFDESSTNLLTYSEQFDNAVWVKTRATIVANTTETLDPYGTNLADKLVDDTQSGGHYIRYAFTPELIGDTLTHSWYIKKGTIRYIHLLPVKNGTTTLARVVFDLDTASVYSGAGYIQEIKNGWYRLSQTFTIDEVVSHDIRMMQSTSPTTDSYTGTGTGTTYVFGAQLEKGAFPTSYIPTTDAAVTRAADIYTSAASTRAAEICTMTGTNFSDWYRQDEGSIIVSYNRAATSFSTSRCLLAFANSNSSSSPRIQITTTNTDTVAANVNNALTIDMPGIAASGISGIYSLGFKVNDYAFVGNGGTFATDVSVVPPTNNLLTIGHNQANGLHFNGTIKSLQFYPKRLTNVELQALSI